MNFISPSNTKDDIWVYELTHITEELRIKESELRQTRWFDYRNKLPMELTQLFADKYAQLYREMYAAHRDEEYSENVTGSVTQKDLLCLWQGRQAADLIGCTYEFYIRFTMHRTFERYWKYIPRPNQLYSEELVLDAADEWAIRKNEILFLAQDDFYKTQSYAGHPDQCDYHDYLIDMVKARAVPEMILTRLIFREKCLTEELAVKHFGSEVIRAASRHFYAL